MRLFILLIVLIVVAAKSNAEIIYTDVDPEVLIQDQIVTGIYTYNVDIDGSGGHSGTWDGDFLIALNKYTATESYIDVFLNYDLSCQLINLQSTNMAAPLENGAEIGSAGRWYTDYGTADNFDDSWSGLTDRFLGVRFKKAGSWRYGWIRLSVLENEAGFTVKDYAYQNTPNTSINAGEGIPASSVVENNDGFIRQIDRNKFLIDYPYDAFNFRTSVIDLTGRVQKEEFLSQDNAIVDLSGFPRGVYFIRCESADVILTKKIAVE